MSETKGQCRREITAAYESTRYKPSDSDMLLADAIDRLAADVASIKAKVDALSPEDVAHLVESEKAWVSLAERQRDEAIRERDTANQRRADTVRQLVQAQAEVAQLRDSRDVANRLFGAEQAKVERLRKELEQRQPAGNSPEIPDSSPAAPQPAGVSDEQAAMDKDRAAVQRYCAAPQPAAPPAGWLTDDERKVIIWAASELSAIGHHRPPDKEQCLRLSEDLRRLVKRHDAGSTPVVEVPPMSKRDAPMQNEALAYRAAMDKAGVKWREVPRG